MSELAARLHWAVIPREAKTLRDARIYRSKEAAVRNCRGKSRGWYIVVPVIVSDGRKAASIES